MARFLFQGKLADLLTKAIEYTIRLDTEEEGALRFVLFVFCVYTMSFFSFSIFLCVSAS